MSNAGRFETKHIFLVFAAAKYLVKNLDNIQVYWPRHKYVDFIIFTQEFWPFYF